MREFPAQYFDKESAQGRPVSLSIKDDQLHIKSELFQKSYLLSECKVQEPLLDTPLIVELPDKIRLECLYDEELLNLLNSHKRFAHLSIFQFESKMKYFIVGTSTLLFLSYLVLYFVIPAASETIADYVPKSYAEKIDHLILKNLDRHFLNESKLSEKRKQEYRKHLKNLGIESYRIAFRSSEKIKGNAFALSGSTIILTDELVKELKNDSLITAIVFHEIAHLEKRHVMEQIIRDSFLTALAIVVVGDASAGTEMFTELSFVLLSRNFMREKEIEADLYAANLLRKKSIPVSCIVESLRKLQEISTKSSDSFFSTHPEFKERIDQIQKTFSITEKCV